MGAVEGPPRTTNATAVRSASDVVSLLRRRMDVIVRDYSHLDPDGVRALLMGLQPTKALGKLKTTGVFREECRAFLAEQIAIVEPRLIVALGEVARVDLAEMMAGVDIMTLMHPYRANMDARLPEVEGRRLRAALDGAALRSG